MYPSGKPYPRLLPPVYLSPIHESEEEVHHLSVKSDPCIVELNNSSVIPKQLSETTCSLKGEDRESSSKTDRIVIESCSGRKLEDVEVLKQKYINNEIQDLPRVVRGPFGHDRIWRSRRCNLNLGSKDIRNQLNKINLKTGTSVTHVDGERQLDYRCKKYSDPSDKARGIRKSVEEILYGDFYNPDDYDPELAALFENYIEECDNVTKKHFSAFPTTCVSEQEDNIFTKYPMDPDAERAFLCGFIEGMKQTDEPVVELDHEKHVQGTEMFDDSVKKSASYSELISSQQDITHMSLREWEHIHRAEQQQKEDNRQKLIKKSLTCKSKRPRHVQSTCDITEKVPIVEGDCKGEVGDSGNESMKDSDIFTDAVHALKVMTRKTDLKEQVENVSDDDKHYNTMKEENIVSKSAKSSQDVLGCHPGCKYLNHLERVSFSPSMREKGTNKKKYKVADLSNQSDEGESIVKLAKQKLEHSMLTTRALEETYLNMVKAKKITNNCKPEGGRKSRNEPKENKTNISKVSAKGVNIGMNVLDELDGWKTKNKAFMDQESVQVSSSELLHPVDSFEKLGSPLWTPASSTPLFSSADRKTPGVNGAMSPALAPGHGSTYGTSPDLENKTGGTASHGSKAFKPNLLGVQGDYKKAAKLVKLRLTKSSDTMGANSAQPVDKSFANVPLSRCINYSIEQNMRSSAMLTTNINLSEKLAQQLKELSNDPKSGALRHRENKPFFSPDPNPVIESASKAICLPPLSGSKLNLDEHKSTNVKVEENVCSLPEITSPSTKESVSEIPSQQGKDHNVSEQSNTEFRDLPHISVKSFPNKTPRKNSISITKVQAEEDNDYLNRGAAVRAGTCASPYTFDKGDPQMLQLKARPLPPLHKVCTSCGGISESQEKTGKQKRKSKHSEKEAKCKITHTRCCGSYVQDKWKLDKSKCVHGLNFYSVGIENHKRTTSFKELQKEEISRPQLILSPTTPRQKCEEMSINFMDKSIKFRFQCDVSVEDNVQDEIEIADKSENWLNNLSTPSCKDRYQCPVTTETRIYKDSVRGNSHGHESTPQPPVPSPYLDYCKYKAKMIEKRKEQLSDEIEYLSDTCLTEDVYMKAAKKIKRFPVIPMKRSKESPRAIKRHRSNISTVSDSGSPRTGSDLDLYITSTKPARLPGMKTNPSNISRENLNNNGKTQTWFMVTAKILPGRSITILKF